MTNIKNTLTELKNIIHHLTAKLDIANLGNWTSEKAEIEAKGR
jgi:hypothetical protein